MFASLRGVRPKPPASMGVVIFFQPTQLILFVPSFPPQKKFLLFASNFAKI
ncbi:hypothetical protein HanHA300_Chr12g0459771 [Helianthus annuus]|nr:hypothetical protein HanHA300_Chr12g0459771 [Helianthus annuus]KAJ0676387.1 hypothetical protein HanLR1_Chr12g0462201 [Helianthus annuus]